MSKQSSLAALALLAFFMADVRDGLGPFLATYLQENHVQQHLIGYTMTAGGLAAMAATPLAGAWADRTHAKRAMTLMGTVLTLAASGVAFMTLAAPVLIVSQVLTGIGGAMLGAGMAAITLGLAGDEGFKKQTGLNEAANHGGNIVSAVGAGLAAHFFGAPWMLAVMAAMCVGAVLAIRAIRGRDIDHEVARGSASSDAGKESGIAASAPWRNAPLLLFGLACASFHLGNAAMLPLLNQRLAAGPAGSAPLLWTGIAIVVAQITMIPVALWVARSRRFDVSSFVYLAILVLPARGALAFAFASDWNNIPVQVLDGIAAGILGVATPLLVQRHARGSGCFNTALGFVMTLQGVGAALSPAVGNYMVGDGGRFGLAFVALACASLIALPLFWLSERHASAEPGDSR